MKPIILLMTIILSASLCFADERKDLELEGKYIIEKERRLQLEWNAFLKEKTEFENKVKVFTAKEKGKQTSEVPIKK